MSIEKQITSRIIMVRPSNFGFNSETFANNSFQQKIENISANEIAAKAIKEFDEMVQQLRSFDIDVEVIQDTASPIKPDAVFPNNWFTTHEDGSLISYPMFAPLRRLERREDILGYLEKTHIVKRRYSLEMFEAQDLFLEGTGSMVLDRSNRIAYACLSPRTDVQVLNKFCLLMNYESCFFYARDAQGNLIYHTNVLMAMGQRYVVCCMEAVDEANKELLRQKFLATGKELVEIDFAQMNSFAGNMIELQNKQGKSILVMSKKAFDSLDEKQSLQLKKYSTICPVSIPVIETIGGGSARCMIAENFLSAKN